MSCQSRKQATVRPRPRAARGVVTPGLLVQLRLAIDTFEAFYTDRSAEQDLLPMLVHAWATFYTWPDPAPSPEARYSFTERLCRERLPQLGKKRTLYQCMDQLRLALYQDLAEVTRSYSRAKRKDRIGEYSLKQLTRAFELRQRQFSDLLPLRVHRRRELRLAPVRSCILRQPAVPVVSVTRQTILLNGFPALALPGRNLAAVPQSELDSLKQQLENRLYESRPAGPQIAQLVLAADRQVPVALLCKLLRLAGRLGVTRICLKTERLGSFVVPCCLPLRLSLLPPRPIERLYLGPEGVRTVLAGKPTSAPVRVDDHASLHRLARSFAKRAEPTALELGSGVKLISLIAVLETLWSAQTTPRGPQLLLSPKVDHKADVQSDKRPTGSTSPNQPRKNN